MAINAKGFFCAIFMLSVLFGGVEAQRRQQSPDILLVSSIARLTELVTDQADKIFVITTELDESKAEIKKLMSTINKLEGKIEEYENLNETKTEIEGLRSDLYAKIEVLEVEQIEQNKNSSALYAKIEVLEVEQIEQNKNSSDLYAKIEVLEVEQIKNLNGTKTDIEGLKVELTGIASYKNETKTDMKSLEIELKQTIEGVKTNTSSEISDVLAKVEEISWPEGSYCILGSGGSCPEGFTRYHGYSKAIWTFRNSGGYTQAATFGDSSIGCYSGCSNTGNSWNVDIIITSCCK